MIDPMTEGEDFVYDEASGEWISAADARAAVAGADQVEVRDSVGNLLADGDQVTLIRLGPQGEADDREATDAPA